MTVIRPNSISGITSITAQANEINVFRSDGTLAGLQFNGVNFNNTSGISTLAALNVTGNVSIAGTLTYQDVTNVDSVGLITARDGIEVVGGDGNVTVITSTNDVGILSSTDSGANFLLFDDDTENKIRTVDGRLHISADVRDAVADSEVRFLVDGGIKAQVSAGSSFILGNDPDTFLGHPANNTLAVTTGGTERVRITSAGLVGIGTVNPTSQLHIHSGSPRITMSDSGTGAHHRINADSSVGNFAFDVDYDSTTSTPAFLVNIKGNERLRIDSTGAVTKPNNPCFRAGRSTNENFGSNGTIVFNYVASPTHFNQGGHYDNSTGAFTAPVAGVYNFYTQVLWQSVSTGQNMSDAFYVYYNSSGGASGGTLVSYDARRAEYIAGETGNGGYYGAFTTVMVDMAANSSVYIRNNRNLTVHGNANFTFFQGYLIG